MPLITNASIFIAMLNQSGTISILQESQMRKSQAFTLIELLVVIAIIAILAAILFPVFAQAREAARTSSCLSNTKQVSLAIMQYLQDYDEKFPVAVYTMNVNGVPGTGTPDRPWGPWQQGHIGWDKIVQPYVKNVQVFHCPSATDGPASTNTGVDDGSTTGAVQFFINKNLSGDPFPGPHEWNSGFLPAKQASLSFPAVTIMIGENEAGGSTGGMTQRFDGWGYADGHLNLLNGDNNGSGGWSEGNEVAWLNPCTNKNNGAARMNDRTTGGPPPALRRHKNGANYAFADGHTKWYNGDGTCVVYDTRTNNSGSTITYKKGGGNDQ